MPRVWGLPNLLRVLMTARLVTFNGGSATSYKSSDTHTYTLVCNAAFLTNWKHVIYGSWLADRKM